MFYSKQTGGFYKSEIHGGNIPADAVEITDAEHASLLAGQSQGKPIKAATNGRPFNEEPPPRTLAAAKTQKLAALAAERYKRETGGVAGVMTDAVSQSKLTGAWLRVQRKPGTTIRWKGKDGWMTVNKSQVEALVDTVSDHVQACFDAEFAHDEAINALTTIDAVDGYDITVGW